MIEEIQLSLMVGLLIFGGLIIGGFLIRIMVQLLNKNSEYLQIFCGGLLTGLFAFELLPDAFSHFPIIGIITGISFGFFIMISLEFFLHNHFNLRHKHQETFYLLMFALIIHSLPTGITFGMSLESNQQFNYGLLAAFILHHFPEGMIIMASIPSIKEKNKIFTSLCLVLSIVIAINIFIGLNINIISIKWSTVMMGMTLGTLGYVTFYEILWKKLKDLPTGKVAMTVFLGIVGIYYFLRFLPSHH